MKRWLAPLLAVIGLAGLIAGWRLYPSTCSPSELYREVVEAFPPCEEGRFEMAVSLGLLAAGAPLFIGGWMYTLTQLAPRITTRVGPRFLAGVLLVGLVLVSGAGWFGWHKYDDHRDAQRLQAAEAALAKLTPPAGFTAQPARYCPNTPEQRCYHTMLSVRQAETSLLSLLHGQPEGYFCSKGRTPVACYVTIRGTVDGYPAYASVSAAIYNEGEPHPAGARQVRYRGRLTKIYEYGNQVSIGVLTPEG